MAKDKCPICSGDVTEYDDYGATFKICRECGWDERNRYIRGYKE